MSIVYSFEGKYINLASEEEIKAGTQAAKAVFADNDADPLACQAAKDKLERDELLSKEEALLFLVWDEAEDAAYHAITLGWLIRGDNEINLVVSADAGAETNLAAVG